MRNGLGFGCKPILANDDLGDVEFMLANISLFFSIFEIKKNSIKTTNYFEYEQSILSELWNSLHISHADNLEILRFYIIYIQMSTLAIQRILYYVEVFYSICT